MCVQFEGYKGLKLTPHPSFSKRVISGWCELEAVLHFYTGVSSAANPEVHKEEHISNQSNTEKSFLERQIELLNTPKNNKVYSSTDLCLAFSWFVRSRTLYEEMRNHCTLPSLSTLQRITRVGKNTEDEVLFSQIFKNQSDRSKGCIIIVDEIYVKSTFTYRGGEIFGYAVDQPSEKANTLLSIMVKCLFGGKKFIAKLIPCHALSATFQYESVTGVIQLLEQCGARVLAVINDNNRVNQCFFKMFTPFNSLTPWIVRSISSPSLPMFLLYDPVHLIKNLRNNWVTEKTRTLQFPFRNEQLTARWSDLEDLFEHERTAMQNLSLSKLTKSSIAPSNIEKQKVSLVLNVFSEKTSAALKTSAVTSESAKETARCIDKIVKLWKVFNTKSVFQALKFNDPDRAALDNSDPGSNGFKILGEWVQIAVAMKPSCNMRVKTLTKDTSEALQWTCECLQSLAHYLLNVDGPLRHSYVCLGFYLQDDLERHFGYFRMASGSNYFLTVQDIFATHAIDRAKLLLDNCPQLDRERDEHKCALCVSALTETEMYIFDELSEKGVEGCISSDEEMAIFYVAGYIASKHPELAQDSSTFMHTTIAEYFGSIDRGRLACPSDEFLHFVLLAYVYFTKTDARLCRNRLVNVLATFPVKFQLGVLVQSKPLQRLANIFLKKFALQKKDDVQVSNRKIAKLSSQSSTHSRQQEKM